MSIENIILDRDRRGISSLRVHLPDDFCGQAAGIILQNPGKAIIVTGFYILGAGITETDGPLGAVVIGNALRLIGYEVVYVTDKYTEPVMTALLETGDRVVNFPIADVVASEKFAKQVLVDESPSVLIAIERCGMTDEGRYRNMRGRDISEYNAKTDYLFTDSHVSLGIGDGGNEIGMGNLSMIIPSVPSLVSRPCMTNVTKLVISSVSNWGGYGLVAAMSIRKGKNLLPTVAAEQELLKGAVKAGAVDGMSGKNECKVDGFTMQENSQVVAELRNYIAGEGVFEGQ